MTNSCEGEPRRDVTVIHYTRLRKTRRSSHCRRAWRVAQPAKGFCCLPVAFAHCLAGKRHALVRIPLGMVAMQQPIGSCSSATANASVVDFKWEVTAYLARVSGKAHRALTLRYGVNSPMARRSRRHQAGSGGSYHLHPYGERRVADPLLRGDGPHHLAQDRRLPAPPTTTPARSPSAPAGFCSPLSSSEKAVNSRVMTAS